MLNYYLFHVGIYNVTISFFIVQRGNIFFQQNFLENCIRKVIETWMKWKPNVSTNKKAREAMQWFTFSFLNE